MSDPNWMLIEARNAVGDFRNAVSVSEVERSATKLADTFEALDEWLLKGGFLPADWLPAKTTSMETLRRLHADYPWTAFVPDEEWLAKIEEAIANPERSHVTDE